MLHVVEHLSQVHNGGELSEVLVGREHASGSGEVGLIHPVQTVVGRDVQCLENFSVLVVPCRLHLGLEGDGAEELEVNISRTE